MSRGRPCEFDVPQALEIAMRLFRERGYEGTTIADLTEAIGINRPSLYAAFGNKEQLFRRIVDMYVERRAHVLQQSLSDPSVSRAFKRLLYGMAGLFTEEDQPRGCLTVHGALVGGAESEPIRRELTELRAESEALIRQRLERAQVEGELAPEADAACLAQYFATVMHGMAVEAVGGASGETLRRVADCALMCLAGHCVA